jgi:glycosyltransferase involved in cell wall biosynthesis
LNVWQVLSGAGPVDAVSRQAVAFRERFHAWGWGGRDVAAFIDPRAKGFEPLRALRPAAGDVLLIHYSAYAPRLRAVLDLPNRKLLLSHNVTPARWLWDHDPPIALQCELGRRQLPEYAKRCNLAAGVSAFNAAELDSDVVIPPILDLDWLRKKGLSPHSHVRKKGQSPHSHVLFVGRLAPHKRQDELIRAFALYRRRHAPDAKLVLVGEPLNESYLRALRELADRAGGVEIESSLSQEQLAERYAAASVFVCLSEHEGFCVPLLEAFAAGVPVIARPSGGVPETAGDAALLVEDRDPGVIAELIALASDDDELRAELTRRGQERVEHYAPERAAVRLRAALESLS